MAITSNALTVYPNPGVASGTSDPPELGWAALTIIIAFFIFAGTIMANIPFGKPSQILVGDTLQSLALMLTKIQFHDYNQELQSSVGFLHKMENQNRGLDAHSEGPHRVKPLFW